MPSYRDPESVALNKYKMITHLFYAFLEPAEIADGSLKSIAMPARFAVIAARAKSNQVKFGVSISGSKSIFENFSRSASSRTRFVEQVVAFAKQHQLDGIDMDWEYPSTTPGVESAGNYTLLMKELSEKLHKEGKFLSAAVTPAVYVGGVRDGIQPEVYNSIDFFNIMQYDGQGWDKDDVYQHASYKMSVASTDIWLQTKGIPSSKAVLGMPLYGRNSSGGALGFREFEAAGLPVTGDQVNYQGTNYWFNGINTIKQKTALAQSRANGIMFWEFSHDSNNQNSLIKAANDQLNRPYQ